MQLPINSIAFAVVALSAVASASQPDVGSSGSTQRFIRKRAPAGHSLAARAKATVDASLRLAKRSFSGQGTFYNPSTGPGACGKTFQKTDPIVAVNTDQFDLSLCYTWITVTANGVSVQAEITDSCPSCSYGDLDFSPEVFDQFATPDQGVFQMTWNYDSDESSDETDTTSTKKTHAHTTTTSTYTPPSTTSTPTTSSRRTTSSTSSTPTPTTSSSSSHSSHSTTSSSSTSTSTHTHASSSSSSSSSTSASVTSSAATSTATDDGDDQTASQTSSGDDSVETLGGGNSNNLGLLSQAVNGFAAIAQAVGDNSEAR